MKPITKLLFCMILTLAMIVPILSVEYADDASVYAEETSGELHRIHVSIDDRYGYVELFTESGEAKAPAGETIELVYHPIDGYHLDSAIFGTYIESLGLVYYNNNRPVENGQFVMPDEDVYILVRFVSDTAVPHTVTFVEDITNGTVSLTSSQNTYYEGETVELIVTPDEGYETEFVGYAIEDSVAFMEIRNNRFTMPNYDVTIKALFQELPSYTIGASVDPAGSGSVTGAGSYYKGKKITLTATPTTDDYQFKNWTENGSVVSTNPEYEFTVNGDRDLVANFRKIGTYTISVYAFPEEMGSVTGGGDYKDIETATVTATPNAGYMFRNWTENNRVVSTDAEYSFKPTANRTLRANFYDPNVTYYPLWVAGKQVTSANAADVFGDGKVRFEPESGDAPPTLTLNNYNRSDYQVEIEHSYAVAYDGDGDFKVVVEGDNNISFDDPGGSKVADGLNFPHASLVITGSGKLNIYGGNVSFESNGIYAKNVLIDNCTVIAKGGDIPAPGGSYGIRATKVTINGGNVTAIGGKAVGYSEGISCDQIEINGGDVTAAGGEAKQGYSEGIACDQAEINGGTVTVSGGDVEIGESTPEQTNVQSNSYGILSREDIEINGGEVTITGGNAKTSRGIECNRTIYIGKGITKVEITGDTSAVWRLVANSVSGKGWMDSAENGEGSLISINKDSVMMHHYKKLVFEPGRYSLKITAKDQACAYDGKTHGPGDAAYNDPAQIADMVTVDGLQPGDSLSSLIVDGQGKEAGEYPLTPSNAVIENNDGTDVTVDYAITYVPGKLTIGKVAPAKVALNAGVKGTSSGGKITAGWGKVDGATSYVVYAAFCGKKYHKVKEVSSATASVTISKIGGKKIGKKNAKYYVVAYRTVNGKKVKLAKSLVCHIVGAGNPTYSNVKSIKVKKSKYTLKKGKKAKIKAKLILEKKGKKPLKHAAKFRYATSDSSVAKVSKKGKIKAVGEGTCTVYVYAQNGCAKAIKVKVK